MRNREKKREERRRTGSKVGRQQNCEKKRRREENGFEKQSETLGFLDEILKIFFTELYERKGNVEQQQERRLDHEMLVKRHLLIITTYNCINCLDTHWCSYNRPCWNWGGTDDHIFLQNKILQKSYKSYKNIFSGWGFNRR